MIQEYEKDENGRYNFPYKCPNCGYDLSPEENIDVEFHNGKYRSILVCGNKGCKFKKILDEKSESEIEEEMYQSEEEI